MHFVEAIIGMIPRDICLISEAVLKIPSGTELMLVCKQIIREFNEHLVYARRAYYNRISFTICHRNYKFIKTLKERMCKN
jgi:hypothetical protein